MAYKYDSHLSLKSGVYYFVRRVPSDLVHHYRSSRISYSLRTRSVRLASARARIAADKLDDYWFHLRVQTAEIPALHLLNEKPKPVADLKDDLSPTLTEALGVYLRLKGKDKGIPFHRAAQRAIGYLIRACGDQPLCSYTRRDANKFCDALQDKKLSGSSITRNLNSVTSVMNFAASEHGITLVNPFSGIFYDCKAGTSERIPVPPEAMVKIKQQCVSLDDDMRWLVALISDTGLRLAEAAGLLKTDLMIEGDMLFVRIKQHDWRRLKTAGSERDVPLVGASLWAAQRILASECDSQFAFPRYNKTETTNANSASAALNKWLKQYVPLKCTVHSFRHSIRDRLRAVECPTEIVDQIGGWVATSVGQGYGQGYPLEVTYKWMKKTYK